MNWLCCSNQRQKTFMFKNGTCVKATNSDHAIQILKSISLRQDSIFKIDQGSWAITFGDCVSTHMKEKEREKAHKLGVWTVYLDRRDLELIH